MRITNSAILVHQTLAELQNIAEICNIIMHYLNQLSQTLSRLTANCIHLNQVQLLCIIFLLFIYTGYYIYPSILSIYIHQLNLHIINLVSFASQVRNHYRQKNQKLHPESTHIYMEHTDVHCLSTCSLRLLPACTLQKMTTHWESIAAEKHNADANPVIRDDDSENRTESILSSTITEDTSDYT